jgi:DNA-binding transcriptional regulator YiaG
MRWTVILTTEAANAATCNHARTAADERMVAFMKGLQDYRNEQLTDPEVQAAYEALVGEYRIAHAILAARVHGELTQEQLADRMGTTQSVIARWESGKTLPSSRTLLRIAQATGTDFCLQFLTK